VVLLPLLVYLRGEQGKRLIGSLAEYCEKGSRVLLLSLPVITIETFVLTEESTGWNRFAYIPFLLSGYVFGSEPRFEKTLCKVRYAGLIGGSLSVMAFFAVSVVTYQGGIDPTHGWALKSVLWRFLKAISSFLWMVAILGFVNRYRSTRRLRVDAKVNVSEGELPDFIRGGRGAPSYDEARTYANEAVMPFYILHQTLVVVLGYYIVKLNAGIGIKYAMTVIGTFLITLVLYEFIVRRTRIARFLFGMKLAPNLGI
jgi:glucan biosynthesis protein C